MDIKVIKKIKTSIEVCSGKPIDEIINYLKHDPDLTLEEKNMIFTWNTPQLLLDNELPGRISEYRSSRNSERGFLEGNLGEISLLLGAYLSPQYKRYMKHLMISFNVDSEIYPVAGQNECECGLCKKWIYGQDKWQHLCTMNPAFGEKERKEYLQFASPHTNVSLCLNCLIQLKELKMFLDEVTPGFLNFSSKLSQNPFRT